MKATGIIRRIDELGRIVIPKEIRKLLRINEGEDIEIYIDDLENIILKKHSNIKNIKDFVQKYTDSIYNILKENIIITDTSNIIAVSGNLKKEIINKEISKDLYEIISTKKKKIKDKKLNITDLIQIEENYKINFITLLGDIKGLMIYVKKEDINDVENKIIDLSSNFLSKYLEE